jgi:hypothetical protein
MRAEFNAIQKRQQFHNNVKPRHFNSTDAQADSPEWYTPPIVFQHLDVEFDMDPCSPGTAIVDLIPATHHLTIAEDGLTTPWQDFVWCNPPYGLKRGMQQWMDKFVAHANGVILIPAYTYTRWFHALMEKVDCILFPLFKLNFINPNQPTQRRNCTLSNCLAALGEKGQTALRNAARTGFGQRFELLK